MSLQVWLPLNGDLHNQGLSNVVVTNYGATVNNNGKIGKCYSLDGTDDRINISNLPNPQNISVAFWMKRNSTTNSRQFMFTAWGGVTCELTASNTIHCYVNGGNGACDTSNAITPNTGWFHLVYTFEDGVGGKLYIDGQLVKSTASSGSISWTTTSGNIGNYSNMYYDGCMNDFRFYDHVLSPKEVEEISKGLILHYKLDDSYIESTTILSCDISETAYNGAINKYGYNDDSNLIKTTGNFQGKNCVKVTTRTSGASATPYVYFSNLFTSDGSNAPAYKTLSFDYYTTVPTTTWLNIYKLGSGSGTATWKTTNSEGIKTGTYTNSSNSISVKPNEWNHIEVTFHGTTEANAEWGYCINGPSHTSNPDTFYFLYANIQLEQKDHATGYGAAMHSNIIYDSSGYNNNGEIINDLQIISTSPRYLTATNLTTTSSHVHVSNLSVTGFSNSYTFTWWGNCSTYSGKMMWGFSDGVRLNGIYNGNLWNTGDGSNNPLYTPGTTTQVSAPSVNVWHHFAMVGNGTQCLVYLDGILWGQAKTYKTISGTSIYFNGWLNNTDYTLANTKLSDFRIYSTALSAAQIKELYDTSVSVDSFGNIHAREVIE